jgi:hypothetical protein
MGTLFLHTLVESYAAASKMVFRTITSAIIERRGQLHDREAYGLLVESTGSVERLRPTWQRAWQQLFATRQPSEPSEPLATGNINSTSESRNGQPQASV